LSPCTWPLLMTVLSCVFVFVLMVRIADAKLFKLDNPIAHQGCGKSFPVVYKSFTVLELIKGVVCSSQVWSWHVLSVRRWTLQP
jgi:hypothetical protein